MKKKIISIVIPVFNEEKNVSLIYHALRDVWIKLSAYDYEYIFVNDGSQDTSSLAIEFLAMTDPNVKYIEFSRNFGKEIATSAGIHYSKGDAVIMIDADLQHPAELIPEFIKKWEAGAEVVVGVRYGKNYGGPIKRLFSWLFYKLMNLINETKLTPNATDFRLLDRKVVDEFNKLTERTRITRGLIAWLGFKRELIYFEANNREYGEATYTSLKRFKLALSTMISQSLFPLRLSGYLGLTISFISGILGLFIFIEKYILNDPWNMNFSGPAILAVILLFMVGIILSCLGLMALYIGNIQKEVSNRPMYIIRQKKNLD